ncbi:MAG: hypothetical protein J07HQW2_03207 [Haloquadratum walsbyi J07HQW2]|uniref:Uncharacterized protein n=1 Tax=Haloquadratum walsbyi J07HQW2 TaxID=1238425 RepID=U1N1J2_9EURY|nr:MAG: hypothetical protein J07HQW2_03207 [Haloquadratum walsbyi J07HQW2]
MNMNDTICHIFVPETTGICNMGITQLTSGRISVHDYPSGA